MLAEIDRNLLQRCLDRQPRSWEDFVDRFLGLVLHVINHTAQSRSIQLSAEDREDLAAEVFLNIVLDDFAVLRRFQGKSSLATYLTVVSRRVVVHELLKRRTAPTLGEMASESDDGSLNPEDRVDDREQVERMLAGLGEKEASVVRMYHLEGKSYQEISQHIGMAENSIGPTLSRARAKLRTDSAAT